MKTVCVPFVVTKGATNLLIQDNTVRNNARDGIQLRRVTGNAVLDNVSTGNGGSNGGVSFFDLDSLNFDPVTFELTCADNVWRGNTWGSGLYRPACTTLGGTGPNPPSTTAAAKATATASDAGLPAHRHGPVKGSR